MFTKDVVLGIHLNTFQRFKAFGLCFGVLERNTGLEIIRLRFTLTFGEN